jgi:D-glycero-D-manno-heptose 1,7-bisphosphate phosphatase
MNPVVARSQQRRPAVFLEPHNTLLRPHHRGQKPEEVTLVHGIGPRLQSLQAVGFMLVAVANPFDYLPASERPITQSRLRDLLADRGVSFDATYRCPRHSSGVAAHRTTVCSCPTPGLLAQAATDLDLDLAASWYIAGRHDDAEAGNHAGCRTILIDSDIPQSVPRPQIVACDTCVALDIVLTEAEKMGRRAEPFVPAGWRQRDIGWSLVPR